MESTVDRDDASRALTIAQLHSANPNSVIEAKRFIVATGLTSEPFMPKLEGKHEFEAPIYHTSELAKAENGLGSFKKVVLLSGAKFSWDIACAYAFAGISSRLGDPNPVMGHAGLCRIV